uniref:Uncharacterized protein n=1 Tax=Arundo donax TaxID=35708 RepID=A0A0A9AGS5_ARUDO
MQYMEKSKINFPSMEESLTCP